MNYQASASAKTILFGEHAVVYGEPAIAIPLPKIRTYVDMIPNESGFRVVSESIGMDLAYEELPSDSGIKILIDLLMKELGLTGLPDETMRIRSDIPIASGLGSGAALSTAVIRVFGSRFSRDFSTEEVNALTYEIEKVYHGTPSGVDNTTITYEQPIIFSKQKGFCPLDAETGNLDLLVIDSGIRSRTIDVVSDVRAHYEENKAAIAEIGSLVRTAVDVLKSSDPVEIGRLMDQNQYLLQQIDVSCPELDHWINLGKKNGALGGKLTGAGRGGNFLILARDRANADALEKLYSSQGLRVIS